MANLPSNAADLTLTQISAKGCDFINSQVAAHVFANTAMKNIYQGEIEKGGRGVTQEFSSDTTGSSITVVRPLPLPISARELGSAINGGNFSAFEYQPASDAYTLNIITVIDDNVDIPRASLSMIPVSIANMYVKNISDKVTLNVNAIKIAAALYTSLSAEQAAEGSAYIERYQEGDDLIEKLTKTYINLDKGDEDHGVTMFPQDDRIGLVSVDWYAKILSAKGVFSLGGANYAYDILRKGTVDAGATRDKLADGYVGDMFGIPFHTVAPAVWNTACAYLGFPRGTLDGIVSLIKSAHGNLFALASGSSIKTIDSPNGQGVRLQPLYRMGAACVMAKSNSILVDSSFENPYGLKPILTGVTWSYKAPGSRRVLKPTIQKASTGKFTINCEGAYAGAWVVGANVNSVSDFLGAYNQGGATKGTLTASDFGTQKTLSGVSATNVVNFLIADADGTIVLAKETAI